MGLKETELEKRILNATVEVFRNKGIKFTMDDIAAQISISKKTIYKVFADKEDLLYSLVDYGFDKIKESEKAILEDETLPTKEKLRAIMGVLPDSYVDLDFRQLYVVREKMPGVYEKMEERLESGWEATMHLLEKGMEEGVIRPISIPIFKAAYEATIEHFLQRDILVKNQIPYNKALSQLVDILLDGILA